MNTGAGAAHGDLFLFLHVDTLLPEQALSLLQKMMQGHGNHPHGNHLWGRFDIRLDSQHWMFRVIETMMNLRSRLTSVSTGDQAIFVSRDLFNSVGGFPEIALMEDIAISKLLREHALPVNLSQRVTSSARRWQNRGILNTIWLMWKLRLYYFLGASPERLARMYR
jgi:rSAM/selenodomain-associated transferase 2